MQTSRYLPLIRLGVGPMADVYLGVLKGAADFQRLVVMKRALTGIADDGAAAETALIDEARIAAALNHPHVVHVYELVDTPEGLILAMEYLSGLSLESIRKHLDDTQGIMPYGVTARVVADVARGLNHAHRAVTLDGIHLGIVHRDVSPKNILVTEEGITKVLDFGIARTAERPTTQHGLVQGTVGYLSPEQARGQPLDYRSDVFSLGVVLYELLIGDRLFVGDRVDEVMAQIVGRPIPPLPPSVPPVLRDIVRRMLVRDVAHRAVDLGEVGDLLEAIAAGQGGSHRDVEAFLRAEYGEKLVRRRATIDRFLKRGAGLGSTGTMGSGTNTLGILETALDGEDPAPERTPASRPRDGWTVEDGATHVNDPRRGRS